MNESINSVQFDIKSRIKYLNLMIWVLAPLVVMIGLIGVPFFSDIEPYWKTPTVLPASGFLLVSLISYILLKFQRYYSAIYLYVYGFIFAPFIATVNGSASSPGLIGLMVGGIIIASVLFRKRPAVIVSTIVTMVAALSLIVLFPNLNQLAIFISISVVVCLSALVIIFKAINDEFENNRRKKLEEVNMTLLDQNKKLKKINDELDRFIYSVSHDIRAPLSSVTGLVNLYKIESNPETKDAYVNHIENSISRLDNYTSDIVDFARNSRTEPTPVRIKIKEYLNSIYSQLNHLYPIHEITYEVYTNGIEEIITDQERLGIILRNIISNSIKYANRSADSYIKCEIEQVNSKNIIRIKDNGMGIEESQMDKVFNMFHRGSVLSDGSGLGLYIARETAEVLGGEIKIASKFMEFTELSIELPNLNLQE